MLRHFNEEKLEKEVYDINFCNMRIGMSEKRLECVTDQHLITLLKDDIKMWRARREAVKELK